MGQAKRRREDLGDAYGTPEGSNQELIVYKGSDQKELDKIAFQTIVSARENGQHVILIGTEAARPLALAVNLKWLHDIPAGESLPQSIAWDIGVALAGGPGLPPVACPSNTIVVLGAGAFQSLEVLEHLVSDDYRARLGMHPLTPPPTKP